MHDLVHTSERQIPAKRQFQTTLQAGFDVAGINNININNNYMSYICSFEREVNDPQKIQKNRIPDNINITAN